MPFGQGRDALQQRQAVVAAGGVFVHDEDVEEEGGDGGFQVAQGGDEAGDAGAAVEGIGGGLVGVAQGLFGRQVEGVGAQGEGVVKRTGDADAAGIGGQQGGPVGGGEGVVQFAGGPAGGVRVMALGGENGFDDGRRVAAVAQDAVEPASDELQDRLLGGVVGGNRQQGRSEPQQAAQVARGAVGDQGFDDAQGGAAQGEGVVGAARREAGGEQAEQAVAAVGEGEGKPRRGSRDLPVLLGQGVGDGIAFAAQAGVVGAHDALQGGHLDHHAGCQVGLGEGGGARRGRGIGFAEAQQFAPPAA